MRGDRLSTPINKQTLLQQVRGSMVNIEKLTEDNFGQFSEDGITYARAKELFDNAGLDISKVIVDPTRYIYNIYYEDNSHASLILEKRIV